MSRRGRMPARTVRREGSLRDLIERAAAERDLRIATRRLEREQQALAADEEAGSAPPPGGPGRGSTCRR
jgi:hypothetical protein